jgi:hypothetical protein
LYTSEPARKRSRPAASVLEKGAARKGGGTAGTGGCAVAGGRLGEDLGVRTDDDGAQTWHGRSTQARGLNLSARTLEMFRKYAKQYKVRFCIICYYICI